MINKYRCKKKQTLFDIWRMRSRLIISLNQCNNLNVPSICPSIWYIKVEKFRVKKKKKVWYLFSVVQNQNFCLLSFNIMKIFSLCLYSSFTPSVSLPLRHFYTLEEKCSRQENSKERTFWLANIFVFF